MGSILIKNGRLWDGVRFFDADILSENGVITAIGGNIQANANFTYDATGMIVSPGLVDIHIHMRGTEPDRFGIDADMSTIPFGVTAAADAGGAHASEEIVKNHLVKNVTFVRVPIRNNQPDFQSAERKLALYPTTAIGLKVYFDTNSSEVTDIAPLAEICRYAKTHDLLVMVHCSNSPTPMSEILEVLNPGDILTHAFHGGVHTARDDDYKSMMEAKKRGVIIDAGFAGHIHTDFAVFRKAVSLGVLPDTISTDITRASAYMRGGRFGMTMCMSMAKEAGMEEADIFRAVTTTPARVLGKSDQWGHLAVGRKTDIAVFRYGHEPFSLSDKAGNVIESENSYRCKMTIANGIIVWRD